MSETKKKKIVAKGRIEEPLPEAGAARDELLARRADDLAELAEELGDEAGAIDLDKIEPINELMSEINELEVSHQQPGWCYGWVWTGRDGLFVKDKSRQGWVVVQGDDPEARELKESATTIRRLGDVILMKIPEAKKAQLDARLERVLQMKLRGVTGTLEEMALRNRGRGMQLHVTGINADPNAPFMKHAMASAAARSVAKGAVSDMIKSGTVPGLPGPGE